MLIVPTAQKPVFYYSRFANARLERTRFCEKSVALALQESE
jgi:hypothetical protein